MKLVNRIQIKLDSFDKCEVVTDQDCSLGQLYDYACAFKAFIGQKIQESENQARSDVKVEDQPKV